MDNENKQAQTQTEATRTPQDAPEAFAGETTPGNAKEATQGKTEPQGRTYTDAEVDAIVAKKLAKAKGEREEAERVAKMTAEEQAAHKIAQLESELEGMRAQQERARLCATVRGILHAEGVPVSDLVAESLIGEDENETRERAQAFAVEFDKAVTAGVVERLKGKTPERATVEASGLTREDIEREKDPVKRVQLIAENMKLFE